MRATRLSRRAFLTATATGAASVAFPNIITTAKGAANELVFVGFGGGYQDGQTKALFEPFEKETGCQVNVKVGDTSDQMVDLMRTGQYDGVSASGNASAPAPAPASAQGSAKASARGSAKASPQPSGHPTAATNAATPPPTNDAASSLLLILVICACFAGAFNAVRELVKERAIYSRERAAGLSTASYLGSKLAVLGFISGVQAAIMVLIGLATRTLPPNGSFLHAFPLAELIIALALLAVVSMALGLFISASVNTSEKTMPILMVVVVVEVVLTGGVFAIAGKVGLEQVAWLSPSRWGYALTASTSNLNKIFPPSGTVDHLWDHTGHQWLVNMAALAALGLVFAFLAWWQLLRQGPARRG